MAKSISVNAKRGRPKTTGTGTVVGVRMLPDQLASLDAWIKHQPGELSRPEAVRRLLEEGHRAGVIPRPVEIEFVE